MQETIREYGSDFDLASNRKYRNLFADRSFLANSDFFRSGRDILRAIAIRYKDIRKRVLLPALCCRPMVKPFEDNGLEAVYYKFKQDLTIDLNDVLSKLEPDDIIIYMNFIGIQAVKDETLEALRNQFPDLIMIEDRTQDYFYPRSSKFVPDYTLCSLRKWLAIPDGALLQSKDDSIKYGKDEDTFYSDFRFDMMVSKSEYLKSGNSKVKELVRSLAVTAGDYLDHDLSVINMSTRAFDILFNMDFSKMIEARKENSKILSEQLTRNERVRVLPGFQPGMPAIYYPILVENRDEFQRSLLKNGIYSEILWPLPAKACGVCEVCDDISTHILALPCDHRYDTADMMNIADIVNLTLEEL
ncbi:MAG TPA: hypothetical protein VN131_07185 [Mobilitalea sp.]|nr:hypothetical protein [Mobilitalea sp.]